MQHTMDVTDVDKGPIRNYNVENALFYISFVVVFSFFFLNIFVALVILTFQEQGEKELVNSELDRNQVSTSTLSYFHITWENVGPKLKFTFEHSQMVKYCVLRLF